MQESNLAPLWLHRSGMIAMLPLAIAVAVIFGPLLGLEIVVQRFIIHWKT